MSAYITGLTALCIPHPGRFKAFWHGIGPPDTWTVAGRNYPDTSHLFGDREIVDVSAYLALAGVQTTLSRCASYERAVFDLLYHHIEQNNRPVPNVQPSDLDDVVNFEGIRAWILEWEGAGRLMNGGAMRAWLG
ncbi:hypothetical protein C9993_01450 [Marinobacter sp. Z-F4-2]|nr:hypothetical protein C9993_01450 [Marinobacter sp. Z-F4-2]